MRLFGNRIELLKYIHSMTRFGSQTSLNRIEALLDLMGNPQDKLKFIHIAGTNGKGSIANMCTNILMSSGYTVGTFTSPFTYKFEERFKVNQKNIKSKTLVDIGNKVVYYIEQLKKKGIEVTEFEAVTAIGFEFFHLSNCDFVCLEVGIGGRYDATNIIKQSEVSIITSISLDHTNILGDTLPKIAGEKAEIIKPNGNVVSYPLQEDEVFDVFKNKCEKVNAKLFVPDVNELIIKESNESGNKFYYGETLYVSRLVGKHQIYNTLTVIKAMEVLREKAYKISRISIMCGITDTVVLGRFEILKKSPLVIIDGAHNLQAIKGLAYTTQNIKADKRIAIMCMMNDKDYDHSVEEIAKNCDVLIAVPIDYPRAVSNKTIADIARQYCSEVYCFDDYTEAVEKAKELSDEKSLIMVCGSFYLPQHIKPLIKKLM